MPKDENSRLIVLADATAVQFYCKCGAPISHIPIETVDGQKISEIARSNAPPVGKNQVLTLEETRKSETGQTNWVTSARFSLRT